MGHDPTSMSERKADDERQAQRQRDADEAPRLRNNLMTATAENNRLERKLADRDAQIERVKALLDSAISDCVDRDSEIARLKAAFDSESTLRAYRDEQLRLLHQDSAAFVRERNEARHEVETWQREYSGALADFEHAQAEIARLKADLAQAHRHLSKASVALHGAGFCERLGGEWDAPSPAPPVEDPRVAALCRLVYDLGNRIWPSWCRDPEFPVKSISDDMNTIAGHR